MSGSAPLLAVVLLAFLVGAAIPVLYQLYRTLRRARALLDTAGPRFERTLDQVGRAADHLNGLGSTFEAQAQLLKPLSEAASKLSHSIGRTGGWLATGMTIVGAIGPSVVAGVRAFFSGADDRPPTDGPPVHRSDKGNGPGDQYSRLTQSGDIP